MKDVCQSCRALSTESHLPARPRQVWSHCWCQSLLWEDSSLQDIKALAAASEALRDEPPRDEPDDLDVLVHLPGGWQAGYALPIVEPEPPDTARPWVRYTVFGAAVVVVALVFLGATATLEPDVEALGPPGESSPRVESASVAGLGHIEPAHVKGGAVTVGPPEELRAVVEPEANDIQIHPLVAEPPEPPQPSETPAPAKVAPVRSPRPPVASVAPPPTRAATAGPATTAAEEPAPTAADVQSTAETEAPMTPEAEGLATTESDANHEEGTPTSEPSYAFAAINDVLAPPAPAPDEVTADPYRPRTLTRTQVTEVLQGLSGRVLNCGVGGSAERVLVDLTVNGATGRVSSARVQGPLAAAPEGRCVSRAVRQARFPLFQDATLNVSSFPFLIR